MPDTIGNRSPSFNFSARHTFSSTLTFSGNAWYRNIRTEGINGNANTDSFDQSVYQPSAADHAALKAAGYTGFPPSGADGREHAVSEMALHRASAGRVRSAEARCNALIIYSKEVQNNYGLSGQMTRLTTRARHNQFTAGAGFDRGSIDFTQNTQFGYLNPNYTHHRRAARGRTARRATTARRSTRA